MLFYTTQVRVKLIFAFLFLHIYYTCSKAQSTTDCVEQIDILLNQYSSYELLSLIDSCSQGVEDKHLKKQFAIARLRALHHAGEYEEVTIYSREVMEIYPTDDLFLAKVHILRALNFEYVDAFVEAKEELEIAAPLIAKYPEEKYYCIFLYRYASFYRVTGKEELAEKYSYLALAHAQKYDFESEEAVANMLLCFITKKKNEIDKSLLFANKALDYWIEVGDLHGAEGMFVNIARIYNQQEKYDSALLYIDKGITLSENQSQSETSYLLRSLYELQATIYDNKKEYEKAYISLQNSVQQEDNIHLLEERKMLLELEYKFKRREEVIALESKNRNLLIGVTALLLLLAVLFCFIFLLYKSRQIIKSKVEEEIQNSKTLENLVETKKILLKELQHRVKNNLALIISLIDQHISKYNKASFVALKERVNAIATLQVMLLENYEAPEATEQLIDIKLYLESLVENLCYLRRDEIVIHQEIDIEKLESEISTPIGLFVNELITNSIKHAQPADNQNLEIELKLFIENDALILSYKDNGSSFIENKQGIGSTIFYAMTRQLEGVLSRNESHYLISIPYNNQSN